MRMAAAALKTPATKWSSHTPSSPQSGTSTAMKSKGKKNVLSSEMDKECKGLSTAVMNPDSVPSIHETR